MLLQIRKVYYPEIEQLLKKVTGGNRVTVFDHVTRGVVPKSDESAL